MKKYQFRSLDEAEEAFVYHCQGESNEQFEQSDIAAEACTAENKAKFAQQLIERGLLKPDAELTDQDVLRRIGRRAKKGKTTMWGRLLVGRMMPPGLKNDFFPDGVRESLPDDIYWSHCLNAAQTWTEDDPDAPYWWLREACAQGWSSHRLNREIQAKGGKPADTRAIFMLDNVEATLDHYDDQQMTVFFKIPPALPQLDDGSIFCPTVGMRLIVTAVWEPSIAETSPADLQAEFV